MNFIEEVEPPGYSWDGQEIGFDAGGFQREDILCAKNAEIEGEPKNYMLEKNSVCQNCADKGQLYFCDVTDRSCKNVEQFKDRVLNSDLENVKCTVSILQNRKQSKGEGNIVWPYFSGNASFNYKQVMIKACPFWEDKMNQAVNQRKCSLSTWQRGKNWNFLISGKDPAFLELMDILAQIGMLCQKHDLKSLNFYNFQALMISQAAIKRSFKHIRMRIYLEVDSCVGNMGINGSGDTRGSDSRGVVQQKIAPCYAEMDCTVNKIQFSSQFKENKK